MKFVTGKRSQREREWILGTNKVQRDALHVTFTYNGSDYDIHAMDMLLEKSPRNHDKIQNAVNGKANLIYQNTLIWLWIKNYSMKQST